MSFLARKKFLHNYKRMWRSTLGHSTSFDLISSGPPRTFDLSKGQTYESVLTQPNCVSL